MVGIEMNENKTYKDKIYPDCRLCGDFRPCINKEFVCWDCLRQKISRNYKDYNADINRLEAEIDTLITQVNKLQDALYEAQTIAEELLDELVFEYKTRGDILEKKLPWKKE
jgi:ribosomal protein S14